MARLESRYVCQTCGATSLRWEGQCRACGGWNTLVETLVRDAPRGTRAPRGDTSGDGARPTALADVADERSARRSTRLAELDRVLGGGLVPGSLVLIGGEPGIGKSTLVLQIAAGIAGADAAASVLYASGEESGPQLRLRAGRLGHAAGPAGQRILVVAETDADRVVEHARSLPVALLVVDSIHTLTVSALEGPAGSVGQVREATARLLAYAKETGAPVLLVGHVTKEGSLAGPKTLEHLVDVVLTLEGERFGGLRLLRASKNRFGSTEEVGVFEMTERGLREVDDPGRAFLGERLPGAPGVAVASTLEGTRPLLIEVQALVAPGSAVNPRRTVAGIDPSRLALLVAVLGRRAGIRIGGQDIYASLVGGVTVAEPALDLPLALALASSALDRPVSPRTVACGEVGLLGELRPVTGLERRLREAARLGFERAVVPASPPDAARAATPQGLEVVAAASLREAIERSLVAAHDRTSAGRPVPTAAHP